MSDNSAIEWTDATWNPVVGCTKVSRGCDHCYAKRITERFHGKGSFEQVVLHPERLDVPKRWRRPRRVFVNSMSDLFHADVPREFIEQVFDVMADTPQHIFQVLTKRAERMERLVSHRPATPAEVDDGYELGVVHGVGGDRVLDHVWLGVSVEDSVHYGRVRHLQRTPAAIRFLSCEPLLGRLASLPLTNIDWVIVGGESGAGARPLHPDWVREIRDACLAAGVAFFFKQWGAWTPIGPVYLDDDSEGGEAICDRVSCEEEAGHEVRWISPVGWSEPSTREIQPPHGAWWMVRQTKKAAGRELDGRTWDAMPEQRVLVPA